MLPTAPALLRDTPSGTLEVRVLVTLAGLYASRWAVNQISGLTAQAYGSVLLLLWHGGIMLNRSMGQRTHSYPAKPPPTMAMSVTIVSDAVAAIGSIARAFTIIIVGSVNGNGTAIFLPGTSFPEPARSFPSKRG